jgi:hypothetical protein
MCGLAADKADRVEQLGSVQELLATITLVSSGFLKATMRTCAYHISIR